MGFGVSIDVDLIHGRERGGAAPSPYRHCLCSLNASGVFIPLRQSPDSAMYPRGKSGDLSFAFAHLIAAPHRLLRRTS